MVLPQLVDPFLEPGKGVAMPRQDEPDIQGIDVIEALQVVTKGIIGIEPCLDPGRYITKEVVSREEKSCWSVHKDTCGRGCGLAS